jgi:hypothetical protein
LPVRSEIGDIIALLLGKVASPLGNRRHHRDGIPA